MRRFDANRETLSATLLTVGLLFALLIGWRAATLQPALSPDGIPVGNAEYQMLMGQTPGTARPATSFPTPAQFVTAAATQLRHPFHHDGANDQGILLQLLASLRRVAIGYGLAILVAVPLGFVLGLSPVVRRGADPFIQILRPISPLAWMPIALYTIRDAELCAIFVIFICSIWPVVINTAFGVGDVPREWLNVARTLEVKWWRSAVFLVLPAAAPMIITGMRVALGIAWLAIVAAEMLVGSSGIGYFVWNQWNSLSIANVLLAVLLIGIVGMILDRAFAWLQRRLTYAT